MAVEAPHGPGGGVLMATDEDFPRLSKSRFMTGLQCAKQLWWMGNEPDAPELVPDPSQERIFARGELARTYVPGGVLIDLPHHQMTDRVAATAKALAEGAPVIYEASLVADGSSSPSTSSSGGAAASC